MLWGQMYFLKILLCISMLLVVSNTALAAMSIDDAYAAIPKDRVTYDPARSKLDDYHQQYFDALFGLVDGAVVIRVELLDKMQNRKNYDISYYRDFYNIIIDDIASLPAPYDIYQTQNLIIGALRDQWRFFEEWHAAQGYAREGFMNYSSHPAVRQSSMKLIQAYNTYMQKFPRESSYNKKAFYTHLCALDFI